MPLLQRIELSNFLNSTRAKPWRPDWPHQVMEIGGVNAALNIPNGKGKSTMVTAILAMLTRHSKSVKDIRTRFFAPPSSGHFTHIRIEVRVPVQGAGEDMFARVGGEPGGQSMVFGMYGYSGDNEQLDFYAYQGTFDDCPVAHVYNLRHTLIADDAFLGQLKTCSNLFPSNAKERTKRAWLAYVEDFFDMSSLKQQLVYQLLRGAEGGHGYFEVNPPTGMNYSAGVFYERLAPELLTDVMGDLGEEGEHGIEDTIHEKVSKVIAAKHETERKAKELLRAENTLRELGNLVQASDRMKAAQQAYNQHREDFSLEMAVLKDVVVDNPIPGVPRTPPESVPGIARAMVMQGDKWFLPDRVMAGFTGEPASEVNRRAHDRNGLMLAHANKSQLIDFACHSFSVTGKRGPSGSLYSRESALSLLKLTANFTRDWTREKAIESVTQAFDWVEAHGDTNPARTLKKQQDAELGEKETERTRLSKKYEDFQGEKERLKEEQSQVSAQQIEYRRMVESRLFNDAELAAPAQTGVTVTDALKAADDKLDAHKSKVHRLSVIYESWQAYVREFGDSIAPAEQAARLQESLKKANDAREGIRAALSQARNQRKGLNDTRNIAQKRFNDVEAKLKRFLETLPAMTRFSELFGTVAPTGLAKKVESDRDQVQNRITAIEKQQEHYKPSLKALATFRASHGDAAPEAWIKERRSRWEAFGKEIDQLKGDLGEARMRRIALNQAAIAAGKVTREAAEIAGGNQVPLYSILEGINLDADRKERVLTLFSALLHAPVYPTVNEAANAATRLEKAGVEAPVFVRHDLEAFCKTGVIAQDAIAAHTWLVGIRTRQVDCLLDPSLVDREKATTDALIHALSRQIQGKEAEREKHDPEHADVTMARRAAEALESNYPTKNAQLVEEHEALNARLPELKAKASPESLKIIAQTEQHHKEFGEISEDVIRNERELLSLALERAGEAVEVNEAEIEKQERLFETQQGIVSDANLAASKTESLLAVQAFIEHREDNPAFMKQAVSTEHSLINAKNLADQRTRFQFGLADTFIKKGAERPKQIEDRLKFLKDEQWEIQNKLQPPLEKEINRLKERQLALISEIGEIDGFIRELIKKYRDLASEQGETVPISPERIEHHPLGGFAIGLREETDPETLIRYLHDIDNDIRGEEVNALRLAMSGAWTGYLSAKSSVSALIEKILVMPDLDMTEHVRIELQRVNEYPEIANHLHEVARNNYEKNRAANKTAADFLEGEWENIGKWLKAFTQRLPDNLKTMKETFGPARDAVTKEYLCAGFGIEAGLAEQSDIQAVLDDVVKKVEKYESTKRAVENAEPGLRDQAIRGLRADIRNTFYQKVIINPRIKVFMPSISKHALPLEKNMVSTGQSVAMTLLWIVKMADYITKRELRRMTTNRVQQQHLHPTQFALMDGAFSSLSNKGLIQDALESIKSTRGRFQLIITGHDENYQNNFDYFPTLIEAREINGQFMYAESNTRRVLQPEEVGSHYGALRAMNVQVRPHVAAQPGQI
ncbi:MAG: hypothetical protein KGZ83_01595 [Sulfuricella sp.]|nr:hypothetical protein [Sulfuricella sp.]